MVGDVHVAFPLYGFLHSLDLGHKAHSVKDKTCPKLSKPEKERIPRALCDRDEQNREKDNDGDCNEDVKPGTVKGNEKSADRLHQLDYYCVFWGSTFYMLISKIIFFKRINVLKYGRKLNILGQMLALLGSFINPSTQ